MPERSDTEIIYYRSKSDAAGAFIVGCILLAFALLVLTQDSVGGIGFSSDLVVMSIYLALPLGMIIVLANIKHLVSKGASLVAGKEGISVLFTRRPVGPIHWTQIDGLMSFQHQGKWVLGIKLENPAQILEPYKDHISPLLRRGGPKDVHLKIKGNMLDDTMEIIVQDLEEMRQLYSWRAE